MPTDRAGLTPVGLQPAALADPAATGAGLRSGDRRWVDQYFEFSCSLGLDYSGEWEADPQRVRLTLTLTLALTLTLTLPLPLTLTPTLSLSLTLK